MTTPTYIRRRRAARNRLALLVAFGCGVFWAAAAVWVLL
jgi:hypothetical protein